jgi:hypothetical protein
VEVHGTREAAMADIVNLNKVRKARAKAEAEELARHNRTKFGRTKGEKEAARKEAERRERDMEGKRLDDE